MVWVWLWSFHYVQLLEHITDNMHKNRDQLKEKLITQHVPARYIPPAHNALLLWSRAENLKDGCDLWVISPPSSAQWLMAGLGREQMQRCLSFSTWTVSASVLIELIALQWCYLTFTFAPGIKVEKGIQNIQIIPEERWGLTRELLSNLHQSRKNHLESWNNSGRWKHDQQPKWSKTESPAPQ